MNDSLLDQVLCEDCLTYLPRVENESIELLLSDIPYGISLDDWDVLHANTNSALLGQSPAQVGKPGFKRRGKPINGWAQSDRNIGRDYETWCQEWVQLVYPTLKPGASVLLFGARRTIHHAINACESTGFLLKDMLVWQKPAAHHRAQRVSGILARRGLTEEAKQWQGWRLGNLAPIWEPIAWLVKPYQIGGTITDNLLKHGVGAMHTEACKVNGVSPTNLLSFGFAPNEVRQHEAQKPLELIDYLIRLTTTAGQSVLDPFMGSGTTAVAAKRLGRHYLGCEVVNSHWQVAQTRLDAASFDAR